MLAWGAINALDPTEQPAAGGLPAGVRCGADSRRLRTLPRPRARMARRGLHGARRHPLGPPAVAAGIAELRSRSHASAGRRGAAAVALVGTHRTARDQDRLGLPPLRPSLRARDLPRQARLRIRFHLAGHPLDAFGRNIFVDTLDSAYGPGWKRENSFLTHKPTGAFCYGFYPRAGRPAGNGTSVSRHRRRAGRDARRLLGGACTRAVRRRARRSGERRATAAVCRRQALRHQLA